MFLWDMVKIMILSSEGRVQLLAAQKPINWPDGWKRKFALFQMLATEGEGGLTPPLISRG